MTEIEKKALALAIETRADDQYRLCPDPALAFGLWEALCRSLEQHEAFKREVSAAVEHLVDCYDHMIPLHWPDITRFILPKPPKPLDPLVEALKQLNMNYIDADDFRAALADRGLEIRENAA